MHYKQNNKESKTYVQGLRSFGNTLPRGVKGILKRNGYNYSEIINKWSMLVGKDISKLSYPKTIKMNRINKKATLIIAVKRGNEIEVEYSKNHIINKINSHFGYRLLNQIKIETFNSKIQNKKQFVTNNISKNMKKKINEIKNKEIRESLSQFLSLSKND